MTPLEACEKAGLTTKGKLNPNPPALALSMAILYLNTPTAKRRIKTIMEAISKHKTVCPTCGHMTNVTPK